MGKKVSLVGLVMLLSMMCGGCWQNKPMNVSVSLDDEMRQSLGNHNIQVDITVLNEEQGKRWEGYSMSDYWKPGDTLYDSVPTKHLVFDPTQAQTQTLWANDPLWKKWLSNNNPDAKIKIYILALLPGMHPDMPGSADSRRKMVPLNTKYWHGATTVQVQVTKDGVNVLTPYKTDE